MNAKFKEIINSNQLILVDFYADWCGPCKMMSPILQEVKGIIKDDVKIIKINVFIIYYFIFWFSMTGYNAV